MEALDVGVGVDEGDGVGALLQVVEELGEAPVELLAEPLADEAGRRGVDEELGEPLEHVDLALVLPGGHHALDLTGDGGGVAPHELVAQRLVVQHLPPSLGRRVEDHALTEDRGHEGIGLGLVEDLLGRPEEELVRLGTAEQYHVTGGQPEHPDVAALVPDALHEGDRVDPEFLEVAGGPFTPGDPCGFP